MFIIVSLAEEHITYFDDITTENDQKWEEKFCFLKEKFQFMWEIYLCEIIIWRYWENEK